MSALEPLLEFLSIPSVSTDPAHKEDVRKAALW
ncbi:M20 family dipeptidase, partial [Streptococcus pneumoniae]